MKLIINYDLVNQIRVANTGFNLQRVNMKMGLFLGISSVLDLSVLLAGGNVNYASIIPTTAFAVVVYSGSELITKELNMMIADQRLRQLCSRLEDINIYTNLDLLKQAVQYKKEFKLVREDGLHICENKYIMLPTTGVLNNDEVSLKQEHEIGSKDYVLSIGEPHKSRVKSYGKVMA